jgi:putative hemolysin
VAAAAPRIERSDGPYRLRLAESGEDRNAAFRLRFLIFNLELNEGLQAAYQTGYDVDRYDALCDHLIVEDARTRAVIGTYRLQTGSMAEQNLGYYSAQEFQFAPYEKLRGEIIELGRACIHRDHRSSTVLTLLWRGIADYALAHGARYLLGCSSLTSQDPAHGTAVYYRLLDHLVTPELCTIPHAAYAMALVQPNGADDKVPKLLRAYLSLGARICGPPAIDREFKTIDFLTWLDLGSLHPRVRARFMER